MQFYRECWMKKARCLLKIVFYWRCMITKIVLKVVRPPLAIKEDGEIAVNDDAVLDLQSKSGVSCVVVVFQIVFVLMMMIGTVYMIEKFRIV